jgi:hypothetical protein
MKNKPAPALLRPSNLSNEIKKGYQNLVRLSLSKDIVARNVVISTLQVLEDVIGLKNVPQTSLKFSDHPFQSCDTSNLKVNLCPHLARAEVKLHLWKDTEAVTLLPPPRMAP